MKAATVAVEAKKQVQLRNILVATDFSPNSQLALDYALAIARRYESAIYLAHVLRADTFQSIPQDAMIAPEWARRDAEEQMAQILISGVLRGVPHQALMEDGAVWPALKKIIATHEIDLAVVGTHGRTGIRKLALGSVAEEVFRMAPCPVMVVGPHTMTAAPAQIALNTIVYTTDLKRHSLRAAEYAFSLAQEYAARLIVHHSVEEPAEQNEEYLREVRHCAEEEMRMLAPPDATAWCQPEFEVTFGEPANAAVALAREQSADLIVLGAKHVRIASHRPAGTAYTIAANAHCPVMIVRGEY